MSKLWQTVGQTEFQKHTNIFLKASLLLWCYTTLFDYSLKWTNQCVQNKLGKNEHLFSWVAMQFSGSSGISLHPMLQSHSTDSAPQHLYIHPQWASRWPRGWPLQFRTYGCTKAKGKIFGGQWLEKEKGLTGLEREIERVLWSICQLSPVAGTFKVFTI